MKLLVLIGTIFIAFASLILGNELVGMLAIGAFLIALTVIVFAKPKAGKRKKR